VIALLVSASLALTMSILGTPLAIKYLRRKDIGQFIQAEIAGHAHKQGTPTMGGVVMVVAVVLSYLIAHVELWTSETGMTFQLQPLRVGGLLAMLALIGMALIGFTDDYMKTRLQRSLGLSKRAKFLGQLAIAGFFAWGANEAGLSTELAFVRGLGIDLGVFFFVLVLLMLTGSANGANLADGMDGLAAGSAALMFGAFTIMAFWQSRNQTLYDGAVDPRELAIVSAAMLGAILGFLWWNAPPARIFMGDVGSNAIGGLLAALALLTGTQLLLVVLAGLYVAETASVIIQVASFKATGNRVFRMAPFHFHFDLAGWPETTVVIRFWILAGIGVALALGFFYADFLQRGGLL
jgi:phospho-N-acetylmuramoyl-pentapeptide-transferase